MLASIPSPYKTVTADLTGMNESLKRLAREAAALPQGSEERDAAEKSIYEAGRCKLDSGLKAPGL